MAGEHFTGGAMPHEPIHRLPEGLYTAVEESIVYACTDVALRDPATGEIFLGDRQTEPQLGPWFVGGRDRYAEGIDDNAKMQVKNDLGIDVAQTRFSFITAYSTDFPVAAPGREDHGRHTQNAVMLVDLRPEEIAQLNDRVASGQIRDEYSHGAWYSTSEIAKSDSDFPYVLKQFVRDLYGHDLMMGAIQEDAIREDKQRGTLASVQAAIERGRGHRIKEVARLGFTEDESTQLEKTGGVNALYGVLWAGSALKQFPEGDLASLLQGIVEDEKMGDFQIRRALQGWGITPPEIRSDNGPTQRNILRTALEALTLDKMHEQSVLAGLEPLRNLGHPGPSDDYQD